MEWFRTYTRICSKLQTTYTLSYRNTYGRRHRGVYQIDGYEFINNPRKKGKGGGVGCYISEKLSYKRRNDLESENIEAIWVEIMPHKSKSYLLCVMYRPPDNSKYLHCNFVELLSDMLLNATINVKEEVILTGDLNVNYLKAKDHHEIKAVIASAGLKQLIKKPTRIDGETKTLIDIFATNNPFVIKDTNVIPTSISDHEMIGAVRKLNCKKHNHKPNSVAITKIITQKM